MEYKRSMVRLLTVAASAPVGSAVSFAGAVDVVPS